jgi:indolepyruvate ferredoxin oxidoreductase beta subunit
VADAARRDAALGFEAAECARLIKGYGETHRRGTRHFDSTMEALPHLRRQPDAAARLKEMRETLLNAAPSPE